MGGVRVLLLEDDHELRSSVATALRRQSYAVDEAKTIADADERLSINT